jgi:drug/metabolite transporter (DMT)-like permease
VAQHLPALRGRWTYLALMGVSGFTAFNALFYAAAHHTTAVNLALIQGMIPVLVLLGGVLFLRMRVTGLQMVGVVITLAGVASPKRPMKPCVCCRNMAALHVSSPAERIY